MTRNDVTHWLERHWKVGLLVFTVGSYTTGSAAADVAQGREIDRKADAADVAQIHDELKAIRRTLDSMNQRQTQFFCHNQPTYCR